MEDETYGSMARAKLGVARGCLRRVGQSETGETLSHAEFAGARPG